jgi:hypothetical protein
LRTRWATASRRGSAAAADWLGAPLAERLAPELDARERDRLAVPPPLLLLRVVRRVPLEPLLFEPLLFEPLLLEPLLLEPLPLDRLLLDGLVPERDPLERREEPRPDEPPGLEPEPLLLAWGMPSSWLE